MLRVPNSVTSSGTEGGSQHSTPSFTCEILGDPESDIYRNSGSASPPGVLGFAGYLAGSLVLALSFSAASIGLWSEIGCGSHCIEALHHNELWAFPCLLASLTILLVLFLLDTFWPPHLPGQYFVLWDGDKYAGRLALLPALGFFAAFCLFIVGDYPVAPLIVSMFLAPWSVFTFRWCFKQPVTQISAWEEPTGHGGNETNLDSEASESVSRDESPSWDGLERRMREFQQLTGGQKDQKRFYAAATVAFFIAGAACTIVFAIWATTAEFQAPGWQSRREQELFFIRYTAPLLVAVSNFMFAMLTGLRVALHRSYVGSCESRSRLVVETASRALGRELIRRRLATIARAAAHQSQGDPYTVDDCGSSAQAQQTWEDMKAKIDGYLQQQLMVTQRLTNVIKILNAAFLVIVGALFVTFQFTATDSHFAFFAQGFALAMMLTFVVYTMLAFTRLWTRLRSWLLDLPIWSSIASAVTKDWFRAGAVILLLPAMPVVLVLSMLNQFVRRVRGLRSVVGDGADAESPPWAKLITARVSTMVASLRRWNYLPILQWCYFWSWCLMLYKLTPLALNLLLAWMRVAMADFHFALILAATFLLGMVLFMLPPVPGPPIYLFGGFVISDKCPWGFWWGTTICIVLCFFLKLTACAIQQYCIGGYLSKKLWVRRTCGVHTPLMRAIELILKRPGLNFGKVMILCGGPDWPTSVLAGILDCSLVQCELGTCPVIASVVPLVLSGSFYLRRAGHGEIWARLGNFMFILTGVVSMVFWAGMAWAIQDEFDKSYTAITAPREEFIDLEWLDYSAAEIAKRCAVQWRDVPRIVSILYIGGVVGSTLVGLMFFWRFDMCFGQFAVDGRIDDLLWSGPEGLVKPLGDIGLIVGLVCCLGLVAFRVWLARWTRLPAREAARELDLLEADWKRNRRREAQDAEAMSNAVSASAPVEKVGSFKVDPMKELLEVSPTEPTVKSAWGSPRGLPPAFNFAGLDHAESTSAPVLTRVGMSDDVGRGAPGKVAESCICGVIDAVYTSKRSDPDLT